MACNHFPPLKIEKPVGGMIGADIEVLNSAFTLAGIEVKTTYFPWKRALILAQNGKYDGLCSCSYTKDRENDFYYSDEIGRNSIGLYTVTKEVITSLSTLNGKRIGVVRGYNLEEELKEYNLSIVTGANDINLLKMLKAKRIDAVYSYKTVIAELSKTNRFIKDLNYQEIYSAPYFTCFSKKAKDNKELLDIFNKNLKVIKANGSYEKIKKKYGL
tara:strand:- start:26111 stop:26755 length:645 start_codon:yes stop_codon:yes gene_type:complete